MKTKIFLVTVLLLMSGLAQAQNASEEESSGLLSSFPDIQITSADTYNNSIGQTSSGQSILSWIIILGIVFLGVVMYSFNIDPKWIVLSLGVVGIVYLLSYFGIIQA